MPGVSSFKLSSAYQFKHMAKSNENHFFLKRGNIKNTNKSLCKYHDSAINLAQINSSSSKEYIFIGAVIFITALGGAAVYATWEQPGHFGASLAKNAVNYAVTKKHTQNNNDKLTTRHPIRSKLKKRREINAFPTPTPTPTGTATRASFSSHNVSQVKECEIRNEEFSYKRIQKTLVRQDFSRLEPHSLGRAVSLLQRKCQENIRYINAVISDQNHLFWHKISLVFPFLSRGKMVELLESCRTKLSAAKEKIKNHDVQFIKCANDGSLGVYLAGMLRKDIYQLGFDTVIYTDDFARVTDVFSAISIILHELKHAGEPAMFDSFYYPYPDSFLFQVESLAEEANIIFSDKNRFLDRVTNPRYSIYANASTDQVTTNPVEIKYYVIKNYPRDVDIRASQLGVEGKNMTNGEYAKILQTRIFSDAGTININEALLFIDGSSLSDLFYGMLEYVRHIKAQNHNDTSEENVLRSPLFIDEFRRPNPARVPLA